MGKKLSKVSFFCGLHKNGTYLEPQKDLFGFRSFKAKKKHPVFWAIKQGQQRHREAQKSGYPAQSKVCSSGQKDIIGRTLLLPFASLSRLLPRPQSQSLPQQASQSMLPLTATVPNVVRKQHTNTHTCPESLLYVQMYVHTDGGIWQHSTNSLNNNRSSNSNGSNISSNNKSNNSDGSNSKRVCKIKSRRRCKSHKINSKSSCKNKSRSCNSRKKTFCKYKCN